MSSSTQKKLPLNKPKVASSRARATSRSRDSSVVKFAKQIKKGVNEPTVLNSIKYSRITVETKSPPEVYQHWAE